MNCTNSQDCHFPLGTCVNSECICIGFVYALWTGEDDCGYTSDLADGLLAVRYILLVCYAVLPIVWAVKLFLLIKNFGFSPFHVGKMITFFFLLITFDIGLSYIFLEAGLSGCALFYWFNIVIYTSQCLYWAFTLFAGWFGLFSLSLVTRMTKRRKRIFLFIHIAVTSSVMLSTLIGLLIIQAMGLSAVECDGIVKEGFSSNTTTTLRNGLRCILLMQCLAMVYAVLLFWGCPAVIFWKFRFRPPAIVRALRWMWFGSLGLGAFSIAIAVVVGILCSAAWNFPDNEDSLDSFSGLNWAYGSISFFTLLYCTVWVPWWINHKKQEDIEHEFVEKSPKLRRTRSKDTRNIADDYLSDSSPLLDPLDDWSSGASYSSTSNATERSDSVEHSI